MLWVEQLQENYSKLTLGIETNSYTSQIGKIKMSSQFTTKNISKSIYKNEVQDVQKKNIADRNAKLQSYEQQEKKGDSLGGNNRISYNKPTSGFRRANF